MSQPDWYTEEVSKKVAKLSRINEEFKLGISKPYYPELIKLRGGTFWTHPMHFLTTNSCYYSSPDKNKLLTNWNHAIFLNKSVILDIKRSG